MHFLSTAAAGLFALSSLAAAVPADPHRNAGSGGTASNRCDLRTNVAFQAGTAPLKSDCDELRDQLYAGKFFDTKRKISNKKHFDYKTCMIVFIVPDGKSVVLGTHDAGDLVDTAINDIVVNNAGSVSGQSTYAGGENGNVQCEVPSSTNTLVRINWVVQHSFR